MPLNKDILGEALYDDLAFFNNKTIVETGDIEAARLAFCKRLAETIIDHFKTNGVLHVPGLGLTAGATAVTGQSNTGSLT